MFIFNELKNRSKANNFDGLKIYFEAKRTHEIERKYFQSEANTFDGKKTVFKVKANMAERKKIIFEAKRTH